MLSVLEGSEATRGCVGTVGDAGWRRALAAIAAVLGKGDYATVRESAHVLKGASANLRASALSLAAAQLEAAALS